MCARGIQRGWLASEAVEDGSVMPIAPAIRALIVATRAQWRR